MNLILSNLEYSYPGSAQKILNGIDLMLTPGLPVLMLGANGAGKSTLLKLMSGNLKLQKGTIKLDDQDAVALPDRIRARHIGVMLQTPPPVFDYTAEEFVLFGRNAKLSR